MNLNGSTYISDILVEWRDKEAINRVFTGTAAS